MEWTNNFYRPAQKYDYIDYIFYNKNIQAKITDQLDQFLLSLWRHLEENFTWNILGNYFICKWNFVMWVLKKITNFHIILNVISYEVQFQIIIIIVYDKIK